MSQRFKIVLVLLLSAAIIGLGYGIFFLTSQKVAEKSQATPTPVPANQSKKQLKECLLNKISKERLIELKKNKQLATPQEKNILKDCNRPEQKKTQTPSALKTSAAGLQCITGVAVPREDATAANKAGIEQGIKDIKNTLGITIIWQLFPANSTQADWQAAFEAARATKTRLLTALYDADHYVPTCTNTTDCNLDGNEAFLKFVASGSYNDVLWGHLLIDEPYEDINAAQLRSLYTKAKTIAPNVNLVVGWSKELRRFYGKPGLEFSDGMCDTCLISALEYRNGVLDEQTLRNAQETSRRVIREKDPTALIISSVPAFGNPQSKAGYNIPDPTTFQHIVDILLNDPTLNAAGKLNGLTWQSWEGPNKAKVASQQTLKDLAPSDPRLQTIRNTCTEKLM